MKQSLNFLLALVVLAACDPESVYDPQPHQDRDSATADAGDGAVPEAGIDGGAVMCDGCPIGTYCDTPRSRCVQCMKNSHCLSGECRSDQTCAPCGGNGDCNGGFCVGSQCVACRGDGDCEQGVCANNTCVQCTAEKSAECPTDAPVCVNNECAKCTSSSQCGERVCDTGSGTCVECTNEDQSACQTVGKVCATGGTECVECNGDNDCPSADESKCDVATHTCVACDNDDQCDDVPGRNVCHQGECVECTRDKASACTVSAVQYVCDPSTHACDLERKAHSKTLCNACVDGADESCKSLRDCVSDDECQLGEACVDVPAGAGRKVCLKVKEGSAACPRPYLLDPPPSLASADGVDVTICTLSSETTCQAHADYRNKRCGTPKPGNPEEDEANSGDDSKCGEPGLADGFCREFGVANQFRCTVPCNNDVGDCPEGASSCDTGPTPDLCSL